jgi:SAM-dependent methyltransferase
MGGMSAPDRPPVGQPRFWDDLYAAGRDGWDLRGPTPVLARLLETAPPPRGRTAVPGCGRGHDARLLARHGYPTVGFDFADAAIAEARRLTAGLPAPPAFEQRDVFTLADAYPEAFDLVWEYTCFPAIDPSKRAEYVDVVRRILRPGGRLLALFFPVDRPFVEQGPPFMSTREEIRRLLGPRFRIESAAEPTDSAPSRRGFEWLVRAVRLDGGAR